MSRTTSMAVIAVVAVVAFGGAFFVFSGDDGPTTTTAGSGGAAGSAGEAGEDQLCGVEGAGPVDGSPYEVTVASEPDPPTPRDTTFEVAVDRDGQPVSGATVCLSLDMTEMSHEASGGQAEETEPGRYEVGVDFGMRGTWEGAVFVTEPGQTPVAAPVTFDVQ
ncbi:MAG: FixH family protein [Actinobacteria bacterium]|nr:FixH family protein [Actinomycetota bacterium]